MALFGVKKRKDVHEKSASPPHKEIIPNQTSTSNQNQLPIHQSTSQPPLNTAFTAPRSNFPNPHHHQHQIIPNQQAAQPLAQPPPPPQSQPPPQQKPIIQAPPSSTLSQSQSQKSSTPQPSTVIYPWSHRRLGLLPPAPFPGDPLPTNGSSQFRPSPAPFPRYGHSVNAMGTPTGSGDLYIFAGLVKDQVKNDLYVLNIATPPSSSLASNTPLQLHNQVLPVGLVETRGEVPLARVGHASVGVGNVLIVWGGDTKTSEEEIQDDGLYLLNLSTREWTRVKISGNCPEGRYGHSAAIIGSKFYIFGGQTDQGGFMNDLWSFDLHKLKSGAPQWQCVESAPNDPTPTRRTGHTVVTHGESIFVFGGTDGQYHYNDTWKFDTTTGLWKELDCIGYIPLPREGHSATLVDDVMYVLGGRGVDGKDLDDLAAFKISNQRWYMFQNMGPAPAGRSGHTMASWQGKVYVLGGESYTSARPDDPSIVHVLDTGKIKYPPDPATVARQQLQASSRKTSIPNLNSPPPGSTSSRGNGPNAIQQGSQGARSYPLPGSPDNANTTDSGSNRGNKRSTTTATSNPPSRPRREDDPPLNASAVMNRRTIGSSNTSPSRTMSPSHSVNASQQGHVSVTGNEASSRRSMSPIISHSKNPSLDQSVRTSPINKPPRPPPSTSNQNAVNPNQPNPQSSSPNIHRISAEVARKSNNSSPQISGMRNVERGSNPQHQLSTVVSQTEDHQRLQKRNMWMKAALATAVKQGFMLPSNEDEDPDEIADRHWLNSFQSPSTEANDKSKDWPRLVEALIQLKRELAKAKTQMVDQAKSLDDRVLEAGKTKSAALQEASFYRVKLAAYESGSGSDLNKLERERIADLESKLSEIVTFKTGLERQVVQLTHELEHERHLREMLEENNSKSNERSNHLEALHSRTTLDYEELLNKTRGLDLHASEHIERYTVLESSHQSVLKDLESFQTKLQVSERSNEKYLMTLEQLQASLNATHSRVEELEEFWEQSKEELSVQKSMTSELNQELQNRLDEISSTNSKVDELERILMSTKRENSTLKDLNQIGLADLISLSKTNVEQTRELISNESREKVIEERSKGLRLLHDQSKSKLESTLIELTEVKTRNMILDREVVMSKAEINGINLKYSQLLNEFNQIKSQIKLKEIDLKEKARLTEVAEVKASLMKNMMAENGMLGGGEEEIGTRFFETNSNGNGGGSTSTFGMNEMIIGSEQMTRRVKELEQRLDQRNQLHKQLESKQEETQREMNNLEEKYLDAHRKHEAAADEIASLVEEVQRLRSGGATSVSLNSTEGGGGGGGGPAGGVQPGKVEEELHVLQERYRTLEQTHIKAVQYVKGTEKMLRRMKDELSKYKEKTENLENELGEFRKSGGSQHQGPHGNGGKVNEELKHQLIELTQQLESLRVSSKESNEENEELQRRMSSLQIEYETDKKRFEASSHEQIRKVLEEIEVMKSLNQTLSTSNLELNEENVKLKERMKGLKSEEGHEGEGQEEEEEVLEQLRESRKQIDWLKQENIELQGKCRDSEAKISLLLDHMENHSNGSSTHENQLLEGLHHQTELNPTTGLSLIEAHDSRFDWDLHRRSNGIESVQSDYSGYDGIHHDHDDDDHQNHQNHQNRHDHHDHNERDVNESIGNKKR
ncbi:hypothetical protein DFH28DRAFT_899475 [Melampsora americana]|nr:hypothetical protein DFH28DRAFT_899475 [Melampsora americana]